MKRIFLCGPMSGLPDNNYPAFRAKAAELRAQGHHVEDPSENQLPPDTEPGTEWTECMKMSIRQLMTCDTISHMDGYLDDRMACVQSMLMHLMALHPDNKNPNLPKYFKDHIDRIYNERAKV